MRSDHFGYISQAILVSSCVLAFSVILTIGIICAIIYAASCAWRDPSPCVPWYAMFLVTYWSSVIVLLSLSLVVVACYYRLKHRRQEIELANELDLESVSTI
jgi:uncharacterized BrkB/YihY/UPF0761 family membrane protein